VTHVRLLEVLPSFHAPTDAAPTTQKPPTRGGRLKAHTAAGSVRY
jgi:hypothetical protein